MNTAAGHPPLNWIPPEDFDPEKTGLGLTPLDGVTHTLLYDPLPSACNLEEGGDGRYESLRHGTYSHHQKIALFEDRFIVYWTQHSRDENGPGQRLLARVGRIREGGRTIEWGGDETLVEAAPAAMPVRRRPRHHDPDTIYEGYVAAHVRVINRRLYVTGRVAAVHGMTDDVKYHGFYGAPVPAAHWSDETNHAKGFTRGVFWDLGCSFVQQWELDEGGMRPVSPLYARSAPLTRIEVTPGRFKDVVTLVEPYASAEPFDRAPEWMRNDILGGRVEMFERERERSYAPGTMRLTADGTDGLAHHTEYYRPDGAWVAVRDNLANPGHYYAAEKPCYADPYPPAVPTYLYGHVMPVAGELPDGRPWIICNNQSRHDMYLTLSDDGRTFNRTWLLMHNARGKSDDGIYKGGGPQYFQAVTLGDSIWVVYSIGKEQIGLTRVPIGSLPAPVSGAKRPNGTPVRHMWDCGRPAPEKAGAGFTVLEGAEHTLLYAGEREAGAYNHHSQLAVHEGVFYAMWSNHPHGEDGPGQRVLYSTSCDGANWTPARELFPPAQGVLPSEEKGLVLTAKHWVTAGGKLYAVVLLYENAGFENPARTERADRRDAAHPFRARSALSDLCREVSSGSGNVGPAIPLGTNLPAPGRLAFPLADPSDSEVGRVLEAVQAEVRRVSPAPGGTMPAGADTKRLCEPVVYRTADGKRMMLLRDDSYSHRMYAAVSPDGRHWNTAVPTDIPDSPSEPHNTTLEDGTILLVGNFMAPEFDNADKVHHYDRDPLMVAVSRDGYLFERAYALRCGQQQWRVPKSEVLGRGGGAQYPSCLVNDGKLFILYSMGKEDIWMSSVPLTALGVKEKK